MNFSINLFHFVVDALGDIRLGNPFNTSCRPVICSLIDGSVAHRKTPMLDLAPTTSQPGRRVGKRQSLSTTRAASHMSRKVAVSDCS